MARIDNTAYRSSLRGLMEPMSEDLWAGFQKWMKEQERVTYYYDPRDREWVLEWFNVNGGFDYRTGPNLEILIEERVKHGK